MLDSINLIGGNLKLSFLHSPINIIKVFFLFFDSFDAYIINSIVVRIIGFLFMYILIDDYFNKNKLVTLLTSISFSLIPVYTIYGISALGLPMILWAFMNIYNGKKLLISYFLIIIFPLYSLIQFSTPFILIYTGLYIIADFYIRKRINYRLLIATIILSVIVITINYNIISTLFVDGAEKSHRFLMNYDQYPSFKGFIYKLFSVITFGDERSLFISIPILAYLAFFFRQIKKITVIILALILFNTALLSAYPIIHNELFIITYIPFNFSRFTMFNTFLFYMAFITIAKPGKFTQIILVLSIFLNLIRNQEFIYNIIPESKIEIAHQIFNEDKIIKSLFPEDLINNKPYDFHNKGFYSYKEFYSEDLFNRIRSSIGRQQSNYLIATIGINPTVTQFNGFRTINAYLTNYPQSLGTKINRINNSKSITYDNGLYIHSDEILSSCKNYCYKTNSPKVLKNLSINFDEINKLNIEYVFSSSKILDQNKNLTELEIFESNKSPYKVFVYKIIKS